MFVELQLLAMDYTIFEFTQESGYLSLSRSARVRLGIPVHKLYIGKPLYQSSKLVLSMC